jgi:hypothetical protein
MIITNTNEAIGLSRNILKRTNKKKNLIASSPISELKDVVFFALTYLSAAHSLFFTITAYSMCNHSIPP